MNKQTLEKRLTEKVCINCKYFCMLGNRKYCGHPDFYEGFGKSKHTIKDEYQESCNRYKEAKIKCPR